MNINQILQESWNFMRNQRQFSQIAILYAFVIQICSTFASLKFQLNAPQTLQSNLAFNDIFPSFLMILITLFYTALLILNINGISRNENKPFFAYAKYALIRFIPLIALIIFIYLPCFFGLSALLAGVPIIALPILIGGLYCIIRLCLAQYIFLIETPEKGVLETLQYTLQFSKGKIGWLLLFLAMTVILPNGFLLSLHQLSQAIFDTPSFFTQLLSNETDYNGVFITKMVVELGIGAISAAVSVFLFIFSVRFYQHAKQIPQQ